MPPGYITTLVSSIRGDLDMRRSPTQAAAYKAAQELLAKAEAMPSYRDETLSIRVDPDS
jgi:hypothetical protein